MLAVELLSDVVPAVHKEDLASEALNWMDVFRVSHLPIVDNQEYLGLISDADIFDLNNPEVPVLQHPLSLSRPFVKESQHIFEVIDLVSKMKITAIPVLDVEDKYMGVITISDLAQELTHLLSADNPGGIIVLELNVRDYSLSEIAQIVEGNDTKILSLYVRNNKNPDTIDITLKLNRTDVSPVIQTFERYNYKIVSVYSDNQEVDVMLKERLDSLLKFMDV
jgi:acetoin utilization protein AcuB